MSDADETVWVIFNGEIYNYKELRTQLQAKGHQFRTNSDTEVIIHGYKEWGTDVFNHLNGMFGLAIWDVRKERLILAQRRHGHQTHLLQDRQWNLNFRFRNPRDSRCAKITARGRSYRVESVSPFPLYAFSVDDISRHSKAGARYTCWLWRKANAAKNAGTSSSRLRFPTPKKKEEAVVELLEFYRGAVKRHLLSDVPVGNSSQRWA